MSRWLYLIRFFVVVPPMPLLMIGAFAVMTVTAAVVVTVDPERAAGALTPILLLQLFANSSGFDVPARRGHYDLLLTHEQPRRRIIAAHWIASTLPGVMSWLLLGLVCYLTSNDSVSLFTAGTFTAVVLVSTIPWATTVRLPRFSGAIGWLLIVSTVTLVTPEVLTLNPADDWRSWLQTAWGVLVYPPLLVGQRLAGDASIVLPGLAFSLAALIVAGWSVNRRDIPLEAAQ